MAEEATGRRGHWPEGMAACRAERPELGQRERPESQTGSQGVPGSSRAGCRRKKKGRRRRHHQTHSKESFCIDGRGVIQANDNSPPPHPLHTQLCPHRATGSQWDSEFGPQRALPKAHWPERPLPQGLPNFREMTRVIAWRWWQTEGWANVCDGAEAQPPTSFIRQRGHCQTAG